MLSNFIPNIASCFKFQEKHPEDSWHRAKVCPGHTAVFDQLLKTEDQNVPGGMLLPE